MRNTLCFVLFISLLSLSASGQPRQLAGPARDMFQGQLPPPGAVSVLGRSFFGSLENGFANSLVMLIGAEDKNVRQELGLTDSEVGSIQLLKAQMLLGVPKYAARFKSMNEESQKNVQEELERDMSRISEHFNNTLSQERKEKAQKLVFQSIGGLESPVTNLSAMEVLNLSDDQKKKMQSVFDEMKEERKAQMEAGLKLIEKGIALGGPNMSPEDREKLKLEGKELEAQIFATGKKLAERLRQHLTGDQLELERQLIASRPAFLPRLPQQMRDNAESGGYAPGADSWQPGKQLPIQFQEPSGRKFPRTEPE